jgi:hypothetical protein
MWGPPITQIVLSAFYFLRVLSSALRYPQIYLSAPGKSYFLEVAKMFIMFGSGHGISGSIHVFEPITTTLFVVFFLNQPRSFLFFGQGIVPFLLTPPSLSQAKIALTTTLAYSSSIGFPSLSTVPAAT